MKIKFEKYGLGMRGVTDMKHFGLKLDKLTMHDYQTENPTIEAISEFETKIRELIISRLCGFLLSINRGGSSKS